MKMTEFTTRVCAVASFVVMWCSVPVAAEAAETVARQQPVSVDSVTISLPVYVTSIIATAIFTWKVGQYDKKRATAHIERDMDELQQSVKRMEESIARMEQKR